MRRLRDGAQILDELFPWLPDGAIIPAWQLIRKAKFDQNRQAILLEEARSRRPQAVGRGFPLYAEGQHLFRDGLIMSDKRSREDDKKTMQALQQLGDYGMGMPCFAFMVSGLDDSHTTGTSCGFMGLNRWAIETLSG